jgi:hypothetical protein
VTLVQRLEMAQLVPGCLKPWEFSFNGIASRCMMSLMSASTFKKEDITSSQLSYEMFRTTQSKTAKLHATLLIVLTWKGECSLAA